MEKFEGSFNSYVPWLWGLSLALGAFAIATFILFKFAAEIEGFSLMKILFYTCFLIVVGLITSFSYVSYVAVTSHLVDAQMYLDSMYSEVQSVEKLIEQAVLNKLSGDNS